MLRVYKMPNGRKYRFDDSEVPQGAVLVEKKQKPKPKETAKEETGEKAAEKKPNKAKKPANKSKSKKVETK